jgi:Fur family ferric uptake transcriptional regulator
LDRLEKLCADKGMRMTDQRRVIARVLSVAQDHPDVEEVHRRAHAVDPHISIATVYRTVRLFEEAGILTRHEFQGGRARYEEAPETHHDHLIDMKTGQVVEFVDEEIEALVAERAPPSTTVPARSAAASRAPRAILDPALNSERLASKRSTADPDRCPAMQSPAR